MAKRQVGVIMITTHEWAARRGSTTYQLETTVKQHELQPMRFVLNFLGFLIALL